MEFLGEQTMRTKYAYVPFSPGATLETDTRWTSSCTRCGPAGHIIVTTDGSTPAETLAEARDGRWAKPVTYAQLRRAGFSTTDLAETRELAEIADLEFEG